MAKGIKLLKDLRVIDLKFELDTRKLATNGSKAVLAECLAKKLQEEGYDAEKFEFNYEKSKVFLIIALLKGCSQTTLRRFWLLLTTYPRPLR